uniref:Sperm flagellar 1 n=1 Tax=Amazona collaria TaxID=241587 RepID=A0A8B9FRQ0_9PSIT
MAAGGGGAAQRALYAWLDSVPLSRPRRNVARDFSDGVLAAEVVKFFLPAMVQLHSYVPASSTAQKLCNWGLLNRKVLSKLNCCLPQDAIRQLVQGRPGAAEQFLLLLRSRIQERLRQRKVRPGPGGVGSSELLQPQPLAFSCPLHAGSGCPGSAGRAQLHGDRYRQYPNPAPWHSRSLRDTHPESNPGSPEGQEVLLEGGILQLKVCRLEELLRLKNVRIDDLSRLLQEAQQH